MNLVTLISILTAAAVFAASAASAAGSGLADAIRDRNPELRALAARASEARARVRPAAAWPDPQLELELMDPMTFGGPRAALRQMLPIAGQSSLMGRMAQIEADMKDAERADRELMLVADGERALAELAYVRRVEALTKTMRAHATHMARVAEAKYAVGKGRQPDVLRAHVARTRLLEPSLGYEARRRTAQAALSALAPGWAPPDPALAPGPTLPPPDQLFLRARERSPMLRMKRFAIDHAAIELQLARAERLPDVAIGLVAGRTMPGDMPYLGGMAMTTLPLWFQEKQGRRVTAAEHRVEAEREALAAAERDLAARLEGILSEVSAAEKQLAIYRSGLLVQVRQAFRVSIAAYQVDQTDFLMVLDALMAYYDAEMAEAMALTERRQMAAMAIALAGGSPAVERSAP